MDDRVSDRQLWPAIRKGIAYIAITIVGHILIVGLFHFGTGAESIPPWLYLLGMCVAAIALPLALLPSIKGAVVGLQYANRMHGL
jgi:uncharacterized protein (DUF983 family)